MGTLVYVGSVTPKSLGWLPNLQEDASTKSVSPTDHFWIKNRKGERFLCDTRFKEVENWSVDTGKSTGELFFEWLGYDSSIFLLSDVG